MQTNMERLRSLRPERERLIAEGKLVEGWGSDIVAARFDEPSQITGDTPIPRSVWWKHMEIRELVLKYPGIGGLELDEMGYVLGLTEAKYDGLIKRVWEEEDYYFSDAVSIGIG